MPPGKWRPSHVSLKLNLWCLILVAELIMDLGAQSCPTSTDWGECSQGSSQSCQTRDDCEGILICCPSKCGRLCVIEGFQPYPPGTNNSAPSIAPFPADKAAGSSTNTAWYYYAGAAAGALLLLIVISVIVVVIVRRRKASANQNKTNILSTPPPPPPPRTPKRNNEEVYCYIDEQDSAPREMAPVPAVSVLTHHNPTVNSPAVFSPTMTSPQQVMMTSPQQVMMTSASQGMMTSPVVVDERFMAVAFANNPTMIGHEEWSRLDFPEEGWVGLYPPVQNSNFYVSS